MSEWEISSDDDFNQNTVEYKTCAGRFCNKRGVNTLSIMYIHKTGHFCDSCKKELEKYGLVKNSIGDSKLNKSEQIP
jgi:hypothetical protein